MCLRHVQFEEEMDWKIRIRLGACVSMVLRRIRCFIARDFWHDLIENCADSGLMIRLSVFLCLCGACCDVHEDILRLVGVDIEVREAVGLFNTNGLLFTIIQALAISFLKLMLMEGI